MEENLITALSKNTFMTSLKLFLNTVNIISKNVMFFFQQQSKRCYLRNLGLKII